MGEVKVFRVIGEIRKPNWRTQFKKEVTAIKREHAIEKVYAELGSKHRVKRFQIEIKSVEEVLPPKAEVPEKPIVGER